MASFKEIPKLCIWEGIRYHVLLAKIFNHPETNYISLKFITAKLMAFLLDKKLSTAVLGVLFSLAVVLISLFHSAAFASSSTRWKRKV